MFNPKRDAWVITAWDIKQYVYCPMIPWISSNYGVTEPPTPSMDMGSEVKALSKERVAANLRLRKPWRFEVPVAAPPEGLFGRVDIMAGRKWLTVVEVKAFKRRWVNHFIAQTMFYAYIINKYVLPVRKAYLVLGKDRYLELPLSKESLDRIKALINRVRKVKTSPTPPLIEASAKCSTCWYRRYCPVT